MSEAQREAAYAAVHAAGWLTDNAWTNGHIWRSVQAALDAYEAAPVTNSERAADWAAGWYAHEIWDGTEQEARNPHIPAFGVDWTCVAHGAACEKSGAGLGLHRRTARHNQ